MKLSNNIQLAYCTNVHRGSTWEETFNALEKYVLKVKELVCPDERFAIGLRLGADAARTLSDPTIATGISKVVGAKELLCFYDKWISLWKFSWYPGKGTGLSTGLDRS